MSVTIFRHLTPASMNMRNGYIDQFDIISAALGFGCTNPRSSNQNVVEAEQYHQTKKPHQETSGLSDEWACKIQLRFTPKRRFGPLIMYMTPTLTLTLLPS